MKDIFFSVLIGISILLPGLSGGTTAVIVGEYEKILSMVANPLKDFKTNIKFTLKLILGVVIGVYFGSVTVSFFVNSFPIISKFLIAGISFALVICLIDDSSLKNIHYSIIGFLVTSLISNISITNNNFFYSLVISLFIAIALVLPGISITNILIAMNTYELTLDAISKLDFRFLIFNFWLVPIWLVFIAKLINNSYKKYPKQTNGFVLGTVFASALEAIPTFSGENLMLGLFTMLFGLFLFLFIYGYCKRANVI